MLIAPHSKLLFIGDSITDCGRVRPGGEGGGDRVHPGLTGHLILARAFLRGIGFEPR